MHMKLLVHVNEPERWAIAIGNITNFLNDVGDEHASVVVVANGAGVKGYAVEAEAYGASQGTVCAVGQASNLMSMEMLSKRGLTFFACRNALSTQNMSVESLPDFVQVVPAGMTEMVKRQAEGYAYIKP